MTTAEQSINKNLLLLLSAALKEKTSLPSRFDGSLIGEICEELQNQTVFPLVSNLIPALPLSGEDSEELFEISLKHINRFFRMLQEQDQLVQLLQENRVSFAVIKGVAAAIYYPIPEYRQMGDIDLLVAPEDFDKAYDLMIEQGYEFVPAFPENDRHAEFRAQSGVEIELHRYFAFDKTDAGGKELDRRLLEGLKRAEQKSLYTYSIPMLPPTENGLVLLSHINHHLRTGLGLRQFIDWMMFVKTHLDDETWYTSFREAARAIGLEKLALTTTCLCKKYLGLDSSITWCDEADPKLARELLEYIFVKGNFGHKIESGKRKSLSVMRRLQNPVAFASYLNSSGKTRWKATEKHRALKGVAWIYRIIQLSKKAWSRKAGLNTMSKEYRQSRREFRLLKCLGITRL